MLKLYVLSVVAGLVAVYGVPLFVKGLMGKKFPTVLGEPSSALFDVVLGWVCFVVAAACLHFAHPWGHVYRAGGAFALAALVGGLMMSQAYSGMADKKSK